MKRQKSLDLTLMYKDKKAQAVIRIPLELQQHFVHLTVVEGLVMGDLMEMVMGLNQTIQIPVYPMGIM